MTGKKKKVLILDDQPDVAVPLQMVLTDHGFDAKATIFVSDFQTSLAGETWDAIVLDVYLPTKAGVKLIGLDLARRIRRTYPGLAIVLISAWLVSKEQIDRCANEIGGKVVWKPLGEAQQVVQAVSSLIEGMGK
jgi:CheY-like chemotaxis protein